MFIGWLKERGEWKALVDGDTLDSCHKRLLAVAGDAPSTCRMMTAGQSPEAILAQRKKEHST